MIPEYATTDIVLAATLKVMNFKLSRIDTQGTKGIFYFTEVDKDVLTQYDMGLLLVEPITFNNAIRLLTVAVKRQLKL
jgi:hypothetical protein